MPHQKFDVRKLERLNDPARFEDLDPARMWAALGSPDPGAIVEIGAGTGLFAARFSAMAPRALVFAVDLSPKMIDWMRGHRSEVAQGRVVPVLADETSVPLADGSSDLVVTINLHHELADPDATYRDALRLLRPGGQILAVDWLPGESPHGPSQAVRVTGEELAGFLSRAGFADATCMRRCAGRRSSRPSRAPRRSTPAYSRPSRTPFYLRVLLEWHRTRSSGTRPPFRGARESTASTEGTGTRRTAIRRLANGHHDAYCIRRKETV
jgi:SAM-dependent methyltransferase